MSTPRPEPDATEVKALEAELAAVRKERAAMQREAAKAPGYIKATERVERDRSALSSAEIEDLRVRVQSLHDDLVSAWDGVDRQRHMLSVLRQRYWTDYQPLEAALDEEAQTRTDAIEAAKALKVMLNVPPPAPVIASVAARPNGDADG